MVQVPQNIAQDFLNAASSNTRRNVETGGFLAGKLVSASSIGQPCTVIFEVLIFCGRNV